jgi:hypothetical protein
MSRLIRGLASVWLLAAGVARGAEAPAPEAGKQVSLRYNVFTHGLQVAEASADYVLAPWGYGIVTHLKSQGLLSFLVHMDVENRAEGRFENDWAVPITYESGGLSRGANRHVSIVYRDADPVVKILTPPEPDREAVVQSDLPHAIDTLSAMALILDHMRRLGQCNGHTHVFDGLRLEEMQVHGPVKDWVPASYGETYRGEALRCDFSGYQIGGFMKDSRYAALMRAPRGGAAWFQDVPGIGLAAVRIEFDHPKLGKMIVVLEPERKKS